MNTKKLLIFFFIASFFILASCASKKKIVYMQNINSSIGEKDELFETKLQPDDLLLIHVSSKDIESSQPFNLEILTVPQVGNTVAGQRQLQLYMIDNEGYIQFPVLGKIKLGGLTRAQVINLFTTKLAEYLQEPIVNLRIMNFKVSVLGEIQRPGTYNISSERITLLDAISMAGDLTIYGQRKNVLVIREIEGKKTTQRIDLTSSDFVNSDFYYLKQNDVVYIEPNKTKVNASAVGPNISIALSVLSLLVTIFALSIK